MTLKDEQYYSEGVLAQDKRIVAKTITLIESSLGQHQSVARQVINRLLPETAGITGLWQPSVHSDVAF